MSEVSLSGAGCNQAPVSTSAREVAPVFPATRHRRLRLATQDCYSQEATIKRALITPRTDCTTLIPSGITTNPVAKGTVFVNLRNAGNLKIWPAVGCKVDLTGRVNQMVSLESVHPRTHQLHFITRNSRIKLTDLWVN